MNTFGADTDEDVTDWGEVNMDEKRRAAVIPDWQLDAMADAVWETIGSMSMEQVRDMLETAWKAGRQAMTDERETCALIAEAVGKDNDAPALGAKIARGGCRAV